MNNIEQRSIAADLRTRGCAVCNHVVKTARMIFLLNGSTRWPLMKKRRANLPASSVFVQLTCGNCTKCLHRGENRSAFLGYSSTFPNCLIGRSRGQLSRSSVHRRLAAFVECFAKLKLCMSRTFATSSRMRAAGNTTVGAREFVSAIFGQLLAISAPDLYLFPTVGDIEAI